MKSFNFAIAGIKESFLTQPNFRFHVLAFVLSITLSIILKISTLEWAMVVLCSGIVMAGELINTAIEYLVDFVSPQFNEKAGRIKDIAAGMVLIASIASLVVGAIIFLPKIINLFYGC